MDIFTKLYLRFFKRYDSETRSNIKLILGQVEMLRARWIFVSVLQYTSSHQSDANKEFLIRT